MTAPDWLDELDTSAGPPWVAMGTRGIAEGDWLAPDHDRERDLAHKAELLRLRHDDVFAALPTPAVDAASLETLRLVEAATGSTGDPAGHPLDAAGRLVQEDLCLLVLRDGAPHLDAASLCFPSYWRLADKLGRPLAEVHGPVAH
ncbi:MAG: heme-dependent oxidative N-demethylase subunit alpha family protein, partial [Acidimicrobiales bacterium]